MTYWIKKINNNKKIDDFGKKKIQKKEKKKILRLASVGFLVVIYIKRNLFGLRSDVTNGKKK